MYPSSICPPFVSLIFIAPLKELNVIKRKAFIGALSLDGMIIKADGLLPTLISAKELGLKKVYLLNNPIVPIHMLQGIECIIVDHLRSRKLSFPQRITPAKKNLWNCVLLY